MSIITCDIIYQIYINKSFPKILLKELKKGCAIVLDDSLFMRLARLCISIPCSYLLSQIKRRGPTVMAGPLHVFFRLKPIRFEVHIQPLQKLLFTVRVGTQWCIIAFQHQLSCLVVATLQIVVNATAHIGACVSHFAALICLIFSSVYD